MEGTEKGLKEEKDRPRRLARRIREVKGWRKGTFETQFVYKCRSHYFRVEADLCNCQYKLYSSVLFAPSWPLDRITRYFMFDIAEHCQLANDFKVAAHHLAVSNLSSRPRRY